jgi:hypothetical protein
MDQLNLRTILAMGFRFRKRIRILPGFRINLSKTGISTSLGGKGLTVNVRNDNVKTTVGLPGTGLSYSATTKSGGSLFWLVLIAAVVALMVLF